MDDCGTLVVRRRSATVFSALSTALGEKLLVALGTALVTGSTTVVPPGFNKVG
jgi:hypothetical protein